MKIGVIGNGFVGKATQILKSESISIIVYDIDPSKCVPLNTTIEEIANCDLIFICVPTPMNKDGSCYLGIIKDVTDNLKKHCDFNNTNIILRSTVTPGTSDMFNTYFMPEFLTEKNIMEDFKNNKNWIFGLKGTNQDNDFKVKIEKMLELSHASGNIKYKKYSFIKNKEAEMVKLFRNNFLSVKVSFCNEIYEYCQHKNIDYEQVINNAAIDERIGMSHTSVPGPDGMKGYGGTCFPKDISNTLCDMNNIGMKSYILESSIKRNVEKDREVIDYKKGRSIL